MIRNENGLLAGYVYVDIGGQRHRRLRRARQGGGRGRASRSPPGYTLEWSGQYENMLRVRERLKLVVPITLVPDRRSCSTPNTRLGGEGGDRAAGGAVLGGRRGLAHVRCSATTSRSRPGSGMIALMGLDAETGVFMLLFLDLAYDEAKAKGACASSPSSTRRSCTAPCKRVRPKLMTVDRRLHGPDADHVVARAPAPT